MVSPSQVKETINGSTFYNLLYSEVYLKILSPWRERVRVRGNWSPPVLKGNAKGLQRLHPHLASLVKGEEF